MASKFIKNTSGATGTWEGQEIANNAYYQIQSAEEVRFINSSSILTSMGAGDLTAAKDDSGTEDITDFADAVNFLKDLDSPSDVDGVPLSRTKITRTGWHFQLHSVEFTTSKLASVYNKDCTETDLGFTGIKYYDSNGTELTAGTQAELTANCVKTVVDWEPDYDIEVIGGTIEQATVPTTDARIWVTAIPDLTVAQGGSVPFTQGGINLRYLSGNIDLDGKTPKLLAYDATYHTNKFRITIVHSTGVQSPIMLLVKLFRENV